MKDEFVIYGIAKSFKDLGFNNECFAAYKKMPKHLIAKEGEYGLRTNGNPFGHDIGRIFNNNLKDSIAAPLWQQAFDWIESKYGIVIYIFPVYRGDRIGFYKADISKYNIPIDSWDLFGINDTWDTIKDARIAVTTKVIEILLK